MKTFTRNKLFLLGAAALLITNGSVFATLWVRDRLVGPTPAEIAALRAAEEQAKLDAIYAKLPPLEPFKSKAKYLRSIGQAIEICENELHSKARGHKSWEINMLESNYDSSNELYKIFLAYETPASIKEPTKVYEVECEVSAEKHSIDAWRVFEK